MTRPKYIIDTNCIISGINELYGPEVFPELWRKIEDNVNNGSILIVAEVIEELERKEDAAAAWVEPFKGLQDRANSYESAAYDAYNGIVRKHTAKKTSETDLMVIAWAKATGATVVTLEKEGGGPHKIPTISRDEGVKCTNLLGLMKAESWKFG